MPIAQPQMTPAEQEAVTLALVENFEDVGRDSVSPIVRGVTRASRGGAPWVNFGGDRWFRFVDIDTMRCILNDDGAPLGAADRGPLVLVQNGRHIGAVLVDTGWNSEDEIIW